MATSRPTRKRATPAPKPKEEPQVLDLRELVKLQPIITSAGQFNMRKMTSLSPLERVTFMELQRRNEALVDEAPEDDEGAFARLEAAVEIEDAVLAMALPETDRETRDKIPQAERGYIIAAFSGATDQVAKQIVDQAFQSIGVKSSPDSSGSTGDRRSSS